MGIRKVSELPFDVVVAARKRLINAFSNKVKVYLSLSGGKDSIVMASLVRDLIREGRIDPKLLIVQFIDEEAIYGSVEKIVMDWRREFLSLGAQFRWYCIEVRHYSCFNMLTNDESFICWDSRERDRWVRPMPKFAITDHPKLNRHEDTYQEFLSRVNKDGISMAGVRVAESSRRLSMFRHNFNNVGQLFKPIYDWRDADVWRYIRDKGLDFPETYMQYFQLGMGRKEMRISQFFSIDTAKNLVRMNEFEPDLMTKITAREPNAYLASLYWDTEMFRSAGRDVQKSEAGASPDASATSTTDEDSRSWREKSLEFMVSDQFTARSDAYALRRILRNVIYRYGIHMNELDWRTVYSTLVAGDPKGRNVSALAVILGSRNNELADEFGLAGHQPLTGSFTSSTHRARAAREQAQAQAQALAQTTPKEMSK